MRAQGDPYYSRYLMDIGDDIRMPGAGDLVEIPSDILIPFTNEVESLQNLLHTVFPDLPKWGSNSHIYYNQVILTSKNEYVDNINNLLIDDFPGQIQTYFSYDDAVDITERTFDIDFLNTLSPNGVPPHELRLKINCPIILLRNLNSAEGLSNGTRLVCRRFYPNLIEAQISDGQDKGKTVFLPRIPFVPIESQQSPFSFKRTQFPVRLCFAMTINKSQGQTLDYVGLYLREPVFSHGQLYVALSRVRDRSSIKVLICPTLSDVPYNQTKNIVYVEVLNGNRPTST